MTEEEIVNEKLIKYWNRLQKEEAERKRDPEAAAKRDREEFAKNMRNSLAEGDAYGDWA